MDIPLTHIMEYEIPMLGNVVLTYASYDIKLYEKFN